MKIVQVCTSLTKKAIESEDSTQDAPIYTIDNTFNGQDQNQNVNGCGTSDEN